MDVGVVVVDDHLEIVTHFDPAPVLGHGLASADGEAATLNSLPRKQGVRREARLARSATQPAALPGIYLS